MANEEIKDQGGVYMAIFQIWGKVDTWWSCKHRGEHKPQLEQECIQASNSSRRTFYKLYQALGASKVELTSRHKKHTSGIKLWHSIGWLIMNPSNLVVSSGNDIVLLLLSLVKPLWPGIGISMAEFWPDPTVVFSISMLACGSTCMTIRERAALLRQ